MSKTPCGTSAQIKPVPNLREPNSREEAPTPGCVHPARSVGQQSSKRRSADVDRSAQQWEITAKSNSHRINRCWTRVGTGTYTLRGRMQMPCTQLRNSPKAKLSKAANEQIVMGLRCCTCSSTQGSSRALSRRNEVPAEMDRCVLLTSQRRCTRRVPNLPNVHFQPSESKFARPAPGCTYSPMKYPPGSGDMQRWV